MNDVKILPLIVDLVDSFFRSSRDALERARTGKSGQPAVGEPTGLNIFSHRRGETQGSLESIVFSFLTIEAAINYMFFSEQGWRRVKTLDSWLRQKWKRSLSVYDRFVLLVSQYSTANLGDFQYLASLFSEFIGFRNRIVHAHPEQYQALVEPGPIPGEVLIHDVEAICNARGFRVSGLSAEIGRISLDDASRGFEIMLLVFSFLDEQLVAEFELPWPSKSATSEQEYLSPRRILESLMFRHYPSIDPGSFVPEMISKLKKEQPPVGGDGK